MDLHSAIDYLADSFGSSSGYEFIAQFSSILSLFLGFLFGGIFFGLLEFLSSFKLRKRVKFLEQFLLKNNDIKSSED